MTTVLHKFRTASGFYIYDALCSKIMRTDYIGYNRIPQDVKLPDRCVHSGDIGSHLVFNESKVNAEDFGSDRWTFRPPVCSECIHELISTQLRFLVLEITQRCNMRCKYCCYSGAYLYDRTHSKKSMDEQTAKSAIELLISSSSQSRHRGISFYGGEPLLEFKKIMRLCDFALRLTKDGPPVSFHIDTNGILLTKEVLRFLISRGIFVQVSLDGPQEIHDRWRVVLNGWGSYTTIMTNLKRILDYDPDYFISHISFGVTLAPPFDLVTVDDFFAEMFPMNLVAPRIVNSRDTLLFRPYDDFANDKRLQDGIDEVAHRYISARIRGSDPTNFEKGMWDRLMIRIHSTCPVSPSTPFCAAGICVPGQRKLFVTSEGTFHPCEKVGTAFRIGNVARGIDEQEVRNLVNEYVETVKNRCVGCWAARLCSLCFARVRKGNIIDQNRWVRECECERKLLHYGLSMYATIMEENPSAFDFVQDISVY